ncbi:MULTISPECIES: lysozyme inhibitor LprI family protein [unclassified Pantoea]|uniref:lysozyme inhibitor LprI family protein n=1 Tax=unclassified Pantoea TaxID=2630326 RepID=UPI001CC2201F|nr:MULTISPECIES: lysozyme inhibitor LprI family protein [unclassified Pantoea]
MKLFKCVFAAASLFISASALADDICVKQPSDGALYQCTVQQKKLAEEELNREYQTAKKRIFQLYGAQKKVADEYVAVMVDTQRNWLKYRDGQCRLEAFAAEENSNANAVATNLCVIRIDKGRTDLLRKLPY